MGSCVLGGSGSLATGMWWAPKLCTSLAGAQLGDIRLAEELRVILVTAPAPLGSSTSSGLPKSCEAAGSCQHRARIGGGRALGGAVTQTPGEHKVLIPPACHRGDAGRLPGVALP